MARLHFTVSRGQRVVEDGFVGEVRMLKLSSAFSGAGRSLPSAPVQTMQSRRANMIYLTMRWQEQHGGWIGCVQQCTRRCGYAFRVQLERHDVVAGLATADQLIALQTEEPWLVDDGSGVRHQLQRAIGIHAECGKLV